MKPEVRRAIKETWAKAKSMAISAQAYALAASFRDKEREEAKVMDNDTSSSGQQGGWGGRQNECPECGYYPKGKVCIRCADLKHLDELKKREDECLAIYRKDVESNINHRADQVQHFADWKHHTKEWKEEVRSQTKEFKRIADALDKLARIRK